MYFSMKRVAQEFTIDYQKILSESPDSDLDKKIKFLTDRLPYKWLEHYKNMTPHLTNVCRFYYGEFEYIFDHYTELEQKGIASYNPKIEDRVVAVFGRSSPINKNREPSRIKGWIGPTEKHLGANTDKGHFIAHKIGGKLDVNIFAQRRDLNRGWSPQGKIYRSMERYCSLNPRTFCFNRPLYSDCTSRPTMIELGILINDEKFWIERFEN